MNVRLVLAQHSSSEHGYPASSALPYAVNVHNAVAQQPGHVLSDSPTAVVATKNCVDRLAGRAPIRTVYNQRLEPYGPRYDIDHLAVRILAQLVQHVVKQPGGGG